MPAVNVPPQRQGTSRNITLSLDSTDHSSLIYHLAIGLAAVVLAIALRSRIRSRQSTITAKESSTSKDSHHPVLWQQKPSTATVGKSRGISSNLAAASTIMSDDHQGPDPSRRDLHETMEPGRAERGLGSSTQDEPEVVPSAVSDSPVDFENPPWSRMARPPPLSPRAPLALTTDAMKLEEGRLSSAVTTTGDVESPLFQRQNSELMSSPSSTSSFALPASHGLPMAPRRRSYTRTISLAASQPSSPAELEQPPAISFTPSSLPSSSPHLPPAPHDALPPQEIDVHGEIVSVEDDTGASWTRHTRVYGGGVCLACLASGGEGGFYGPKVPLEDRR